jgi:hypothetical protein
MKPRAEHYAKACHALLLRLERVAGAGGGRRVSSEGLAKEHLALPDSWDRLQAACALCFKPAGEAAADGVDMPDSSRQEAEELRELIQELCGKVEFALVLLQAKKEGEGDAAA